MSKTASVKPAVNFFMIIANLLRVYDFAKKPVIRSTIPALKALGECISAFSGLLAGAVGAAAYCMHCPEMAPPFLGTWYLLGMALPAAASAAAGPLLLRW